MVFKKKELMLRMLKKLNHPILKSKPKKVRYSAFLEGLSKNLEYWMPIFIGLLAAIFINLMTKEIIVQPKEVFSFVLTWAFTTVVLASLLVSFIVAIILYLVILFLFGTMAFLIQKLTYFVQAKFGSISIILLVIILTALGFLITFHVQVFTSRWLIGLLIEFLGVLIGLFLADYYLKLANQK